MITNSVAIVLKRFPYSESSIIARCFVREIGKVSFIVHGAHRKKSPMGSYFQPINCLDLVYYYKETRDLQTVSKASFSHSWSAIPMDLKKISYAMAVIEFTDKCLIDNDAHPDLYDELVKTLITIEKEEKQLNLAYWFYQYQLLKLLGFKPDFNQSELDYTPLPNPYAGPNTKSVFKFFENGQNGIHMGLTITPKDRKVISDYLNTRLGIHFDGIRNLKSIQILREMFS